MINIFSLFLSVVIFISSASLMAATGPSLVSKGVYDWVDDKYSRRLQNLYSSFKILINNQNMGNAASVTNPVLEEMYKNGTLAKVSQGAISPQVAFLQYLNQLKKHQKLEEKEHMYLMLLGWAGKHCGGINTRKKATKEESIMARETAENFGIIAGAIPAITIAPSGFYEKYGFSGILEELMQGNDGRESSYRKHCSEVADLFFMSTNHILAEHERFWAPSYNMSSHDRSYKSGSIKDELINKHFNTLYTNAVKSALYSSLALNKTPHGPHEWNKNRELLDNYFKNKVIEKDWLEKINSKELPLDHTTLEQLFKKYLGDRNPFVKQDNIKLRYSEANYYYNMLLKALREKDDHPIFEKHYNFEEAEHKDLAPEIIDSIPEFLETLEKDFSLEVLIEAKTRIEENLQESIMRIQGGWTKSLPARTKPLIYQSIKIINLYLLQPKTTAGPAHTQSVESLRELLRELIQAEEERRDEDSRHGTKSQWFLSPTETLDKIIQSFHNKKGIQNFLQM